MHLTSTSIKIMTKTIHDLLYATVIITSTTIQLACLISIDCLTWITACALNISVSTLTMMTNYLLSHLTKCSVYLYASGNTISSVMQNIKY